MSLEADLYTYLSADPGLQALIGTGIGADEFRLYPKRLPQGPVYPSVTYMLIDAPRHSYTHDQAGNPPTGTVLVTKRIQFDCWAAKDTDGAYEDLLPVVAALITPLSGFKGDMGATFVQSCFMEDEADGFEPDTGSNRRRADALLTYEES